MGVVVLGHSSSSAAILVVVTASDMAPGVAVVVGVGAELVVGGR